MNEMRALGLQPGEGCHVMALKACADAGRWEHALAILEGMKGTCIVFVVGDFFLVLYQCTGVHPMMRRLMVALAGTSWVFVFVVRSATSATRESHFLCSGVALEHDILSMPRWCGSCPVCGYLMGRHPVPHASSLILSTGPYEMVPETLIG